MTEKQNNVLKCTLLLFSVAVFIFLCYGIKVILEKEPLLQKKSVDVQTIPDEWNNREKWSSSNQEIDGNVANIQYKSADETGSVNYLSEFEHFGKTPQTNDKNSVSDEIIAEETYIDTPTIRYPRLISSGLFPLRTSVIAKATGERASGNMSNVAVIIESTNWNDTNRWISSLTAQRNKTSDLIIYLFTDSNQPGASFDVRKSWSKSRSVVPTKHKDLKATMEHALRAKEYVVYVKDYEHLADDFADFYFVGKSLMELDHKVESVCGGSNGIWQDKELGDILWLSHSECKHGEMKSRRFFMSGSGQKTGISMRPEVARVGGSERSVNRERSWNIVKVDPTMLTKNFFEERLNLDLKNAIHKKKVEWNLLMEFDCLDSVYTFPYENDQDLQEYFENVNVKDLHEYDGVFPLSIGNCRMYIVPAR